MSAPWILASDLQTTITVTLTNIDNQPNTVELIVDPWNQYVRYKPGIEVTNGGETTTPDWSGFQKDYILLPQEKRVVTLVPDDAVALATQLATVMNYQFQNPMSMNGNGVFNHAMDLQNRPLQQDPLVKSFVPASTDIPALVGFDIGFRTTTAVNVALEVSVDVVDTVGNKVLPTNLDMNNQPLQMPTATLAPPKAPAM
jgi:hypothetical protein